MGLVDPPAGAENRATALAGAANTVIAGVLLRLASALAIAAIPAMFCPLLSRCRAAGAFLMLVVGLFEALACVPGALIMRAVPLDPPVETALSRPVAPAEMVFAISLFLRGFGRGGVNRLAG